MKILHVHNHYRTPGGEDRVFAATLELLVANGHRNITFERSSAEIRGAGGRVRAFTHGIYSFASKKEFRRLLVANAIDVVHIHNVYPLISPSILPVCKEFGLPVVMRCPNYRLLCPTALLLRKGAQCEKCVGGREHWCLLTNCSGNIAQSLGLTLRNYVARKLELFIGHVDCFLPPSEYVKTRLVAAGFDGDKIRVLPNMVHAIDREKTAGDGDYVAFVGSLHQHKGIDIFVRSAGELSGVRFRIAGSGPECARLEKEAPANVHFEGHLAGDKLEEFYRQAAVVVVPSLAPETFGLAAAEAMGFGLPVIASNIGALPEVVRDKQTGLLFEPGNVGELSQKIELLLGSPTQRKQMGENGRVHCFENFSAERHYHNLLDIYSRLVTNSNRNEHAHPDARLRSLPISI